MRFSALYTFIGVVFGVPILFGLIIKVIDYYQESTWEPPPWPPSTQRIQHPDHVRWGEAAVNRFNTLGSVDRETIRGLIKANISDVDSWVRILNQQRYELLCLGESHDDYIRRYASLHIFNILSIDVLFIEATQKKVFDLIRQFNESGQRIELLGADLSYILGSVLAKNPDVEIYGIEETPEQKERRQESLEGGRETSIEANLRHLYQPGKRHVILIGAFHCSDTRDWLYYRLNQKPGKLDGITRRSIRVSREHIEGSIEAFVYFLDEIGASPKGHFVIKDNVALPLEIKEWFPFLNANELGISDSLLIFRP